MNREMKKIIFSALFLFLFVYTSHAWAAPELNLSAVSGQPGGNVNVVVSYVGDGAVVALQFDVQYDASQLTSGTPTAGSALGSNGLSFSSVSAGSCWGALYPC